MIAMRKLTTLTVLAALLFACGPKSKTVVTPILPGDGDDNTQKPTDPVDTAKGDDPWAKADLIDEPEAAPPAPLALPAIEEFTLKNGLQVFVVQSGELPVVSMQLAIKAGRADEPHTKLGVSSFVAGMLTKGTKKKSALDIAKAIDFIGGGIDANASYEATLVSCSAMAKDLGTCMSLLPEIVMAPAFPKEELGKVRDQLLTEVRQRLDDAGQLAGANFQNLLWGDDHVRGWVSNERSIAAITREDLVKWHKAWFSPSNALLAVSGDVDVAKLKKQLEKAFGTWKATKVPARPTYAEPKLDHVKVRLVDKPRQTQTHIRIGQFGIAHTDPEFFESLVWNYALGGGVFSSRLMKVVRAEGGKTYGASSTFDRNLDKGSFVAATFTRTAETVATTKLMIDEIAKMAKDGPTDDEVSDAIANIAGSYALRFESANDVAGALLAAELHGFGKEYLANYAVRVGAVDSKAARAAAADVLDPNNFVIVLVGDAAEIEPQLKAEGWRYEKVSFKDPIGVQPMEEIKVSAEDEKKARAFLDAALDAKGGKKIKALKTLHMDATGQITSGGQPFDVVISRTFETPDKMRVDLDVTTPDGNQAVSYAISGTTGWQSGVNPQTGKRVVIDIEKEDVALLAEQRWHDPEFILTRHLEKGSKVIPLPDEKVGNMTCAVINVTAADGVSTATLFIDRKTKLIVQMAYPENGDVTLDAFGDYKEVEGIMIAHKRQSANSQEGAALTIEKVEIDPAIDAKIFDKPSS